MSSASTSSNTGPRLIEVSAQSKDFAEDSLKVASVALTAWALNSYVFSKYTPLKDTAQMLFLVIAGLAVHHLVVDRSVVRFVVQSGQESMYEAMRKLG